MKASNKLQKSCQIYSRCKEGSTEVSLCNMSVAQQMAVLNSVNIKVSHLSD